MNLIIIFLLLCCLVASLSYIHRYCINPYFLHLVVGSKGSGKSLYMSRIADQWYREHRGDVFSNTGLRIILLIPSFLSMKLALFTLIVTLSHFRMSVWNGIK